MSTTTICLIRHGETDWNTEKRMQGHTDIPLNEKGRQQARKVAARLAKERWDALYSSDLQRAAETARIISMATGVPAILTHPLRERRLGQLEGKTRGEINREFPDFSTTRFDRTQIGVEDFLKFRERALAALTEIAKQHPGQRVMVVSHGGFINIFLHVISNGETGTGRILLANTSLSIVRYQEGQWIIDAVNDTAHLDECQGEAS